MAAAHLLWAIGLTLGSWALLGLCCAGVGLLVTGLKRRTKIDTNGMIEAFWVGLCSFIAFLQVYHFTRPIDRLPIWGLGVCGLLGVVRNAGAIGGWLARLKRERAVGLIALGCGLVFLADRAIASPGECYDTGLYHASAIRWALTAPVVPGLANLHCRFGFNNSIHLFGAAITAGPWGERAGHIVNGLIFCALLAQCAAAVNRLGLPGPRSDLPRSIFEAMAAPPFVLLACQFEVTGFPTDGVAAAMLVVAGARVVEMATERKAGNDFAFVSLLLSTAVTVKLSTAPFAAAAWLLSGFLMLRGAGGLRPGGAVRILSWPVMVGALLVVPWMARGVILSGYPLFPSKLFGMPVPWQVPAESADALTALIRSWARAYSEKSGPWFGPWLENALFGQVMWILAPLVVIAVGVGLLARRGSRRALWAAVPCIIGIPAWLATAPDPRFGFPLFWMLAGVMMAATIPLTPGLVRLHRYAIVGSTLALALVSLTQRVPFIGPGPDSGFHPMPAANVKEVDCDSGLKIFVPERGDQCWDAPLPCAPFIVPGLSLRRAGDIKSGFFIDRGVIK